MNIYVYKGYRYGNIEALRVFTMYLLCCYEYPFIFYVFQICVYFGIFGLYFIFSFLKCFNVKGMSSPVWATPRILRNFLHTGRYTTITFLVYIFSKNGICEIIIWVQNDLSVNNYYAQNYVQLRLLLRFFFFF